jgi:hypothetical protein
MQSRLTRCKPHTARWKTGSITQCAQAAHVPLRPPPYARGTRSLLVFPALHRAIFIARASPTSSITQCAQAAHVPLRLHLTGGGRVRVRPAGVAERARGGGGAVATGGRGYSDAPGVPGPSPPLLSPLFSLLSLLSLLSSLDFPSLSLPPSPSLPPPFSPSPLLSRARRRRVRIRMPRSFRNIID